MPALKPATIILSTSWGLLLAFSSGFFVSVTTGIVKYLANVNPSQLAAYRFFATTSFSLPQLIFSRQSVLGPPGHRISVVIQAIASATAIILQFFTFRYLPLGEAAVLISSYPSFVTLSARIFLKEPFGVVQAISLLAAIVGMILITGLYDAIIDKPRVYTTENIYGFAAAFMALAASTVSFTLTRKMKAVHFSVLMFTSSVVSLAESVIIVAAMGDFSLSCKSLQPVLLVLLGFLSYFGLFSVINAFKFAEAGPVTIIKGATDILFSFVWQVIVFGDIPGKTTIIGAALVCVSIVLVGLNQRIGALLPEKYLCCAKDERKSSCSYSMG